MINGTIIKGIGGFYYIKTEKGVYECRARGIFRKDKITPIVGDYVEIDILDDVEKKGSLVVIKERKNELIRPRVANVNQALIVFSIKTPNINLDLLDRFIILATEQNLDIVICINKIELDTNQDSKLIYDIYSKAGYKVILFSAKENINMICVKNVIEGKISVLAGPSGAGKSSMVNALNKDLSLDTGTLSKKTDRGRHTTRHAELMEVFEGGFIVDSPGFTSLHLDHVKKDELQFYFKEFGEYISKCRFSVCSHTHEPGCGVKDKVGNAINKMRYNRYVNIYNELDSERRK